jgi:hypothetical protein
MSFFQPPAPPTGRFYRPMAVSPPAWFGPPRNVLPGSAPITLIVARSDQTVVAVTGIQAYPAGFGFTLNLRLGNLSGREEHLIPYLLDDAAFETDPLPDEFLRFGVQFADGRKTTNLDQLPYDLEQEPDQPVLHRYGRGVGSIWDMEQWVWPLPPTGPFAYVCAWPARGIPESRAEIDGGLILDAAERAVTLWPDD